MLKIFPFSFIDRLLRFHKRLKEYEDQQKDLLKIVEDLRSRSATMMRDLELLREALEEKTGILKGETVKKIVENGFSSETYRYFAFENQFRGNNNEILKAQTQYLPRIEEAQKESKGEFVLDVGCGRGEFLTLLKQNNIPCRGLDLTQSMVDSCKEKGLEVSLSDALIYLQNIKDQTLIGITAFQVIEHLPVEYLTEFIKTSFSKIKDHGVLILETVNPNSFTSLKNFYLDLTHKNPIPPLTMKFLLEDAGFKKVTIHYTSYIPDHEKLQGKDRNTTKLNEILFGPQDYAVIGQR